MMDHDSHILILGAHGMVGKALENHLRHNEYDHIITPSSSSLDLKNQQAVSDFMKNGKFDYIFFLAAKVGGIMANISFPATFLYDNLMMEANVINAAKENNVKKLLFMASSCCYPRECLQPMKEEYLLTGSVEPTNEAYSISKIAGIKLCETYNKQYGTNFISCLPCNIYGEHDNFDLQTSHVMSALIQKFHVAKIKNQSSVTCMGTGGAKREFVHVKDVAAACLFLMNNYDTNEHINIGTGEDISIYFLAQLIKNIVGYEGEITWDSSKPDGMPRKVVDTSKINSIGWKAKISLADGIRHTYKWFLENHK